VLVIDDEQKLLVVLGFVLEPEHDVSATTDAHEALEWIDGGERYDVILCDLMMPEMTGMDLHAELERTAPELAERIVFLTGGAFSPGARAFLDRVPNLRIEKPFDSQALLALVNERMK
jgi:CheY-like chemotaxis protein